MSRVLVAACLAGSFTLGGPRDAHAETQLVVEQAVGSPITTGALERAREFADSFATGPARARRPGGDLAAQLAAARPDAGIGNAEAGIRGDHEATLVLAPARSAVEAPRMTLTFAAPALPAARRRVPASVHPAPHPADGPIHIASHRASRNADEIVGKVQSTYLLGLVRCQRAAGSERTEGKVTLMFTVDANGVVKRPTVSATGTGLDACVRRRMMTWRFPEVGGASRQSAMVSLTLALAPGE